MYAILTAEEVPKMILSYIIIIIFWVFSLTENALLLNRCIVKAFLHSIEMWSPTFKVLQFLMFS